MTDFRWLELQRKLVELRIRTPSVPNYTGSNSYYYGDLNSGQSVTNGAHAGLINPAWQPGTEMIEIRAIRIPDWNGADLRAPGLNAIHT